MNNSKLQTAVKLFRIPGVLAMNSFIYFPVAIISGNYLFATFQTLPFIFIIAGEIAFNDCCDLDKDRINKPHRPLVSGSLQIKTAFMMAFSVIILGLISGVLVYLHHPYRLSIFVSVTVILTLYNLKCTFVPLIKTVITAIGTVLALLFAYTYLTVTKEVYILLTAAFLFIFSRECMMDIRDISGDSANNYRTLAVIFGARKILVLAFIAMGLSAVCSLIYISAYFNLLRLVLCSIIIFSMGFCCFKFAKAKSSGEQNRYILLLWIPMILMLLLSILRLF